tara:strand:+ start:619 stop:957 length:339 start_codon:yes stop_codon:yes gene_type:complete
MGTPFKMKGPSLYKDSPMKQNGDKLGRAKHGKKVTKDTRTPSQKARDKRDLERQTRIQLTKQKNAEYHKGRKKKELKEKGYYTDETSGKRYTPAEEEMGGGKKRKYWKEVRD